MTLRPQFRARGISLELVRYCGIGSPHAASGPRADDVRHMPLALLSQLVEQILARPEIERVEVVHLAEPCAHPQFRDCLEILAPLARADREVVLRQANGYIADGDVAEALQRTNVVRRLVILDEPERPATAVSDAKTALPAATVAGRSRSVNRGPHFATSTRATERASLGAGAHQGAGRGPVDRSATWIDPSSPELPLISGPVRWPDHSPLAPRRGDFISLPTVAPAAETPCGGCSSVESDVLHITLEGWAQPCAFVENPEFHVGRFPDESFEELLNGPRMTELRHKLRLDQRESLRFCRTCLHSLGAESSAADLRTFWQGRDLTGKVQDLTERRYLFEQIVPGARPPVCIDLGCGPSRMPGCLGVDRFPLPGVDVVTDLDGPLPFADNSVDLVVASHSLEHVRDLMSTMRELWRICKHGAQVCVVGPYSAQGLNHANPYHLQTFNEHTPRFWTTSPDCRVDPAEYFHPHAPQWGLGSSDYSDPGLDLRCVRMEFFYFPDYLAMSAAEQRWHRQHSLNVCDQIFFHLVAIKDPAMGTDLSELMRKHELYDPAFVGHRRQSDALLAEIARLKQQVGDLASRAEKSEAIGATREEQARLNEQRSAVLAADLERERIVREGAERRAMSVELALHEMYKTRQEADERERQRTDSEQQTIATAEAAAKAAQAALVEQQRAARLRERDLIADFMNRSETRETELRRQLHACEKSWGQRLQLEIEHYSQRCHAAELRDEAAQRAIDRWTGALERRARQAEVELAVLQRRLAPICKLFSLLQRVRRQWTRSDDAFLQLGPAFQQLRDDGLLFHRDLTRACVRATADLGAVPFIPYHVRLPGRTLTGVSLAALVDGIDHRGLLGAEVVFDDHIHATAAMPVPLIREDEPVTLSFDPVTIPENGQVEIRVFVRDTTCPVRVYEWQTHALRGFGRLSRQIFCGFHFA